MPLPSNLNYTGKIEGSAARSYRNNISPNGPTYGYSLGDTININIATRNNLVLAASESYIEFDLQINNTSGAASSYRLDSCGIHGLFQRVKEVNGSNVITDNDNYGNFAKVMYDLQSPFSSTFGKLNIMTGSRSDFVSPVNVAANTLTYIATSQTNSGELLGASIATGTSTVVRTYCVNLISFLGSLSGKQYIPLFALTSAPITLQLTLVDSILKFCAATSGVGSITISNIQFVAQFIELSDQAMGELTSQLGSNRLEFPLTQFKNFSTTFSGLVANNQISINVPAKYASLKSYIITQRESTGLINKFPFSSIVNNISTYQFKIGPNTIPSSQPNRLVEMFCEVLKVMGSISDLLYNPNIDLSSYTQNSNTALAIGTDANFNSSGSGSFYIGIDLENFPNSPKDSIFAGYNSMTDDTAILITYNSNNPPIAAPRFDIYACFDSIFVCENGVGYIRA